MRWLQISLATTSENAEAVADVLARFSPGGTAITGQPGDPPAALTVRAYLPEADAGDEQQLRIRQSLWHLSQIAALPEPSFDWIEDDDWGEAWKSHFHPIPAGRRLMIIPAWMQADDDTRLPIYIDPGMAFGTGAHPSTRLCLAALEDLVRPGDLVADLGCGSGILGIAAALFGAGQVVACDLDEQAVSATRRGAERNGVGAVLEVFPGSLAELRARLADRRPADILVANILAPVIAGLLEERLADTVRAGGHLILAGILADQREPVDRAARRAGLGAATETAEGEWIALTYTKTGAAPNGRRRTSA